MRVDATTATTTLTRAPGWEAHHSPVGPRLPTSVSDWYQRKGEERDCECKMLSHSRHLL